MSEQQSVPSAPTVQPAFKNKHLSFSRISRFEQCPMSFKLHYVDRYESTPNDALLFGKAVHEALEILYSDFVKGVHVDPLSPARAQGVWQLTWAKYRMTGIEPFEEGLALIRRQLEREKDILPSGVLAIEKEFSLAVGDFKVKGFIDRVDRIDDETIDIRDYKTNRMLYTREELDSTLQMSIYRIAAKQLWPWAKRVWLTFDFLRHDVSMSTTRTEEQLSTAEQYIQVIGNITESISNFLPRLNTNCVYCDHRQQCEAYQDALRGEQHLRCDDLKNVQLVAREREELAAILNVVEARKKDLDRILKTNLEHQDSIIAGGRRYSMTSTSRANYPLDLTLRTLGSYSDMPRDLLLERLAKIQKKDLDGLVREISSDLDKSKRILLKMELDGVAKKTYSPRLKSQKVELA